MREKNRIKRITKFASDHAFELSLIGFSISGFFITGLICEINGYTKGYSHGWSDAIGSEKFEKIVNELDDITIMHF